MNIIAKHEDKVVIAIGDIHRNFSLIKNKIIACDIEDCIMFVCGDFGVGYYYNICKKRVKEKRKLRLLNLFLKNKNNFLYVVRGNHDNPIFFDGNHNFSNIIFMQDYDVVEVGEHMIAGIGGATSVDRKENPNFRNIYGEIHKSKIEGKDWWAKEKLVYDEELLSDMAGIDVVITHICPTFIYPDVYNDFVNKWIEYDPELKNEILDERNLMAKIYNKLNELSCIKYFIYGHYHRRNQQDYYFTKFCLLDIGEFMEIRF